MRKHIVIARGFSSIFRPMYYPTVGTIILLTFTYMSMFPWAFRLMVLGVVYFFTVLLPVLTTYLYRSLLGWRLQELRERHKRFVPYAIHFLSYLCCMYLLDTMHMPRFITAILFVSLLVQTCCIIINMFWKVSMHSAGSGAVIGGLVAYSTIFGFNPIWWLCGTILLSGCVMTSRMVLLQHSLAQVLVGTMVGVICGFFGIIFI